MSTAWALRVAGSSTGDMRTRPSIPFLYVLVSLLLGFAAFLSLRRPLHPHSKAMLEAYETHMEHLVSTTAEEEKVALIRQSNALAATYFPPLDVTPFPTSFWFVKNVKVGGSTLAGVMRSLCGHYGVACINPPGSPGKRIGWKSDDEIQAAAVSAKSVGFEHVAVSNHGAFMPEALPALGDEVLMLTMVRHPVGRTLSAYFYNILGTHRSHEGLPIEMGKECVDLLREGDHCPLLDRFRDHYVHGNGTFGRNHIFKYIKGNTMNAADAFNQYDFVFMTERFDESLVSFMLTYGLTMADIAYLRMKDRSGTYPRENDMPSWAIEYILERNKIDLDIWKLATNALDSRIRDLKAAGHDFEGAMTRFSAMQAVVQRECADYVGWYKEHGFTTMLTYWGKDNGAGNRCIRSAVRLAGYG